MRTSQYKVQNATTVRMSILEHQQTCDFVPLRTGLTTDHTALDRTWPGKHGSSRLPTPTTRRHWRQRRLPADCSKLSAVRSGQRRRLDGGSTVCSAAGGRLCGIAHSASEAGAALQGLAAGGTIVVHTAGYLPAH